MGWGFKAAAIPFSVLFLLFFVLVPSTWPQTVVRVGFYENRPLSFRDSDGRYRGITVETLEHIADEEGWQLRYVPGSWQECLKRLEAGELDILSPIAFSEERSRRFDFNRETVINNWGQVYIGQNSEIDTILDLSGARVAVMANDIHEKNFQELIEKFNLHCETVQVEDYQEVFRRIEAGEVDAGVVNRLYGRQFENRFKVRRSSIIFYPIDVRFASSKGTNADLLAAIDRELSDLKKDKSSIYYKLQDKWLGNSEGWVFTRWFKWILFSATAALALSFLVSLTLRSQVRIKTRELEERNRRLREEIAERNRAEAGLRESEERYRSLVENVDLGISLKSNDHRFRMVNSALCRILGVPAESLIGRTCYQALYGVDAPCSDCPGTLAMETGESYAVERKKGEGAGRKSVLRIRAFPLFDSEGKPSGFIEVVSDITREWEIDRLKSELISTAAHEFKTPLSAIFGFAELLLNMDGISPEEQKEYLTYIYEKSEYLTRMVEELLDIARIEEGRGLELQRETCRLEEVLERATRPFRRRFTKHRFEVDLPREPMVLRVDRGKIEQVMENLLSNAVKFSPGGGEVRVAGEFVGGRYRVSVADQGIGMTPEQRQRVFEKFYRADASHTSPAGSGIGMYIVQHIIEAHGGEIRVESTPGQGTTILFSLPAEP